MEFLNWFIDPVKNQYADFNGRTGRKAFWMFVLVSFLISFVLSVLDGVLGTVFFGVIFSLGVLVPSIAITARRLHDTGKSGWWQLIGLIPFIGTIILIVLCVLKGDAGSNKYGPATIGSAHMYDGTPDMTDVTPVGEDLPGSDL